MHVPPPAARRPAAHERVLPRPRPAPAIARTDADEHVAEVGGHGERCEEQPHGVEANGLDHRCAAHGRRMRQQHTHHLEDRQAVHCWNERSKGSR